VNPFNHYQKGVYMYDESHCALLSRQAVTKFGFAGGLLVLASLLFALPVHADMRPPSPGIEAIDIERKADEMQAGYIGESRKMTLTLINADGQESQRKLDFWGFEEPDRHDKTLVKFTFPPDIKGTTLLTYEKGAEDDDQWLYLPSLKRAKRIASSNKSGSFVGSEFAYEDLVVRQFEKYNFKYIGDDTVDGKDCFVIERTPKNQTSGYSKILRWRYKDNHQEAKSQYYDRKGELLKERFLEGHHLVDGFWRTSKITVKNVQTKKASTLAFDDIKLKLTQDESLFSVRALESVQ
jgi:hypothetical protein